LGTSDSHCHKDTSRSNCLNRCGCDPSKLGGGSRSLGAVEGSGFHVGALAFAMLSGGSLCPGIGQASSVSPSRLPLGQAWAPCCVQSSARGSGQKLATLLQMHPGRILHVLRTRSTEFAAKICCPSTGPPPIR